MLKRVDESPDSEQTTREDVVADDWLQCGRCGQDVTRQRWAIPINGDHLHTVFNPAGHLFRVRCFLDAPGVLEHGEPSDHFTWFKGYEWRLVFCRGCKDHLGWAYTNRDHESAGFFGLIGTRLRDASRIGGDEDEP